MAKLAGRVFLVSPARIGGPRSSQLMRPAADFELAVRLRRGEATIGEVYTFISGLYFRGKVAYAGAFSCAPGGGASALVIFPGKGLVSLETLVSGGQQRAICGGFTCRGSHRTRHSMFMYAPQIAKSARWVCPN